VYRRDGENHLAFVPAPDPSAGELQQLVQRIAVRIGRALERSGPITRDIDNSYLALDPAEEPPIHALLGASITYRRDIDTGGFFPDRTGAGRTRRSTATIGCRPAR